MVIFHSYVSLPEGKWMSPRALRGSPEPTRCSDLGSQVDLEALVNAAMDEMRSWVSQVAPTRLWRTWLLLVHAEWFFPQNCDTVDGFEIRNTTPIWDVWKPINSGMFTTVFNWCRISQPSTVMWPFAPSTSHHHFYRWYLYYSWFMTLFYLHYSY